jgi:hypothetical protein
MFAWLSTRRSTTKQLAELLAQAMAQLQESQKAHSEALALCEKWSQLHASQSSQLAAARSENARLWTALTAPKELQPYVAVGFSEAEAGQLAKEAPRGA